MALSETDNSDCNSDSSVDGTTSKERKEKHLTKIVVRRLPPSMNKETFMNQVSPIPDYDYLYFVRADMSLGEYAYSRAYINFKNSADIFIFKEKFDNYVFLDSKGNEYAAVVEFAPFSRIPKKRNKRPDPKCATIESDPIYTEFIESLNEVTTENEEKPEYCFQPSVDDKKEITNTPLLDYVKQRRIDRQKIKEEKREERKRKELERKRIKDDERKIREKSYTSSTRKQPFKSTSLNVIDETKSDTSMKLKERKPDEYKNKSGKPSSFREREYPDKKTSYVSSKSIHSSVDRKPPPKMRQRTTNYQEKEPRRSEYKSSRREDVKYNRKEEQDDKVMEKKVKKYSERREERKNEIKKTESKVDTTNSTKDDKPEIKNEDDKFERNKESEKKTESRENARSRDNESREHRVKDNDTRDTREHTRSRENDPRTQRRIRNKDRPAMQIYQPGMLKNRSKPSDSNQDDKNSIEDEQKTD